MRASLHKCLFTVKYGYTVRLLVRALRTRAQPYAAWCAASTGTGWSSNVRNNNPRTHHTITITITGYMNRPRNLPSLAGVLSSSLTLVSRDTTDTDDSGLRHTCGVGVCAARERGVSTSETCALYRIRRERTGRGCRSYRLILRLSSSLPGHSSAPITPVPASLAVGSRESTSVLCMHACSDMMAV